MTDEERFLRRMRLVTTEDEWLTCDQPHQIHRLWEGKTSDRKARLFECACLRRLWDCPWLEEHHWAIEVQERHADGEATPEEALAAAQALRKAREYSADIMGSMWSQLF